MNRRGLLAVAILAVFVAVGLWNAAVAGRPPAPGEEVRAVAATLRCPTCVGESAADSTAPLAAGMRDVIADQLAAGRTPAEIREWFAVRYGQEVLLDPPRRGLGWLLWLLPLAAAPVAAWFVLGRGRTRAAWVGAAAATVVVAVVAGLAVAGSRSVPDRHAAEVVAAAEPVQVLEAAARHAPGDVAIRSALARALDSAGRVADSVEHYAAVTRLTPADDRAHYLLAFALVRSDRADEAVPVLEDLLERNPEHPESLLLLGTLWQDSGGGGEELLRRFLDVAPDHPAADDVAGGLGRTGPDGDR
jgi:cytochrome c-type biogenesis protein CcmH/NrfF